MIGNDQAAGAAVVNRWRQAGALWFRTAPKCSATAEAAAALVVASPLWQAWQ
jgi:hypothetical protein